MPEFFDLASMYMMAPLGLVTVLAYFFVDKVIKNLSYFESRKNLYPMCAAVAGCIIGVLMSFAFGVPESPFQMGLLSFFAGLAASPVHDVRDWLASARISVSPPRGDL